MEISFSNIPVKLQPNLQKRIPTFLFVLHICMRIIPTRQNSIIRDVLNVTLLLKDNKIDVMNNQITISEHQSLILILWAAEVGKATVFGKRRWPADFQARTSPPNNGSKPDIPLPWRLLFISCYTKKPVPWWSTTTRNKQRHELMC